MRLTERGAALVSVILTMVLIFTMTIAVMAIVQADVAGGIRQQQAVRVFNIAEGGLHYAIAKLQAPGASTYPGETVSLSDGATTIGTALVVVDCLDSTDTPPCETTDPARRRVVSTGSLAGVTGPTRVVTAIVEGLPSDDDTGSTPSPYAICAYESFSVDQQVTIYGLVGSNGDIAFNGPPGANRSAVCDSTSGGLGGRCSTPNPAPSTPFSAGAYAEGTITCSQGCVNQIEGTVAPNQPAGTVCPTVTLSPPTWTPTTDLTVPRGGVATIDPSTDYGMVTLASTTGNPNPCPTSPASLATLIIDSGSDPAATVQVRIGTLSVGKCARLQIDGVGKVELWLLDPTSLALFANKLSVFGTTSATPGSEVPIDGGRFTINVISDGSTNGATPGTAVHFDQAGLISGTFIVPSGGYELDQAQITNGAILANTVQFDQGTGFAWDPDSSIIGDDPPPAGTTWGNFDLVRSWKDQ